MTFAPTDITSDTMTAVELCQATMAGPDVIQFVFLAIGIPLFIVGIYCLLTTIYKAAKGKVWVADAILGIVLALIGVIMIYEGVSSYIEVHELAETAFNTYMIEYTDYYKWDACSEEYIRQLAEQMMR